MGTMKQILLHRLTNGPIKGTITFDDAAGEHWTHTGLIEPVAPVPPATAITHVRIAAGNGEVVAVSLDDLERGEASLTTTNHFFGDLVATARAEAFAEVSRVLDFYDTSDDEIGECAPEDRWRLYRDLRALTGASS